MLQWIARHAIYPAPRTWAEIPSDYGTDYQDIEFASADGCQLHGWWLPHHAARATIIHCHANGENVGSWAGIAAVLESLNCNFLLFDYRGYGRSMGKPSQEGIYADAAAAFDWLAAEHPSLPVVAMGRSLGTAVAVHLAIQRPLQGIVLEGAFTSLEELALRLSTTPPLLLRWAVRNNRFDTLAQIGQVAVPKLFAHSPEDELVPYEMGRRLYDAAREPKAFYDLEGGHNEPALAAAGYREALAAWLNDLLAGAV